jgi:hypothetical protein
MPPEQERKAEPERSRAALRANRLPRGMTPRLLSREAAAAYCGVGPETFEQRVGVTPLKCFGNRILYDRVALDLWLDQQSGLPAPGATGIDWSQRL